MPSRHSPTPYHHPRWRLIRQIVLAAAESQCQIRGPRCKGTATTVDHVIPLSQGGSWFDLANLRAACTTCNYGRVTPVAVDKGTATTHSRTW